MEKKGQYNSRLIIVVIILLCVGVVMVYSASHHIAFKQVKDSNFFVKRHVQRVVIGILAMIVAILVPYDRLLRFSKWFLVIGLLFLVAIYFVGVDVNDQAKRWIRIGSVQFQPVDFARLCLIIYLSEAMARKQKYIQDFKQGLLPQAIVLVAYTALLMFQPDLGSALLLACIAMTIFATAGAKIKHLVLISISGSLFALFIKGYQIERVKSFVESIKMGKPISYQIEQSLIALGNGGWFGVGLDHSTQKLQFLPQPFTDFIFSIVGEEFGFVGVTAVLFLFLLVIVEGYRIALNAPDEGARLLATGLTTSIALYAFVNAGVVSNLLPTKGLPMPFISYGGSFTVSMLISVGILVNISHYCATKSRG
ncbi:putative lipid II flippase FtsW [candidate division KSB1 bacterium]|nr:MAG: putative lipid II flippase FtsW [candidate division KSB1 bacterium]